MLSFSLPCIQTACSFCHRIRTLFGSDCTYSPNINAFLRHRDLEFSSINNAFMLIALVKCLHTKHLTKAPLNRIKTHRKSMK